MLNVEKCRDHFTIFLSLRMCPTKGRGVDPGGLDVAVRDPVTMEVIHRAEGVGGSDAPIHATSLQILLRAHTVCTGDGSGLMNSLLPGWQTGQTTCAFFDGGRAKINRR